MFYKLIREKVTESVTFQITVTSIEFDHYERGKGNIDEHGKKMIKISSRELCFRPNSVKTFPDWSSS